MLHFTTPLSHSYGSIYVVLYRYGKIMCPGDARANLFHVLLIQASQFFVSLQFNKRQEILVIVILALFSQKQYFKNSSLKVQLGFWLEMFSPMFWSKYVHQTDVR